MKQQKEVNSKNDPLRAVNEQLQSMIEANEKWRKERADFEKEQELKFPMYSYYEGILYYRIDRNYFNGVRQTVAKVWKWLDGAEKIAQTMTQALEDNKKNIPSLQN
ncbi:MAG: hypothetical protein IT215_00570 [Chitinophagaceae bacterium]|nr:hypothetical protein [Chitinophagaceae bacterium]